LTQSRRQPLIFSYFARKKHSTSPVAGLAGWWVVAGCWWLVGWLAGWLVGWLTGWLAGSLAAWLAGWLAGGWLLVGWLAGYSIIGFDRSDAQTY